MDQRLAYTLPCVGFVVAWSPDCDHLLAVGCADGTVRLYFALPELAVLVGVLGDADEHPFSLVRSIAWSSDGRWLAFTCPLEGVQVHTWGQPRPEPFLIECPTATVVAWSRNGAKALVTGHLDRIVRVWSLAGPTPTLTSLLHPGVYRGFPVHIVWSADRLRLGVVYMNDLTTARVWTNDGDFVREVSGRNPAAWIHQTGVSMALTLRAEAGGDGVRVYSQLPSRTCRRTPLAQLRVRSR